MGNAPGTHRARLPIMGNRCATSRLARVALAQTNGVRFLQPEELSARSASFWCRRLARHVVAKELPYV
jgi:hypothetical protein